ncbi:recombinase family protein [Clostridium tetani]|uniref:recombinase family protein n=1 Tax=Clostridium tetani TaxID=1513 RepID=UPI001027F4D8|nr:recombinase family protein [Clostridium tetani]RXI70480.1 recombinase family protein [Clostridium tetani]
MRYYAYHRTSTTDQYLDRGINAINNFCKDRKIKLDAKIYTDQCTGKNFDRPAYKELKEQLLYQIKENNEEVVLIVTELDRLGRNKTLTLHEIRELQDKGIRLMVLEIPTTLIDLSVKNNDMAKMMMETINNMLIEMYASFAHAEMEKRTKRQKEGIEAKKARGEWSDYGRPRVLAFEKFCKEYKRVLKGDLRPTECMKLLGINKSAYYRYRKEYKK